MDVKCTPERDFRNWNFVALGTLSNAAFACSGHTRVIQHVGNAKVISILPTAQPRKVIARPVEKGEGVGG